VEETSFEPDQFDVVISSAVLHFARDEDHWQAMVNEMWRVLSRANILRAPGLHNRYGKTGHAN